MFDLETLRRDLQERPFLFPVFNLYNNFMNIRRYDHFPFYIYPSGVSLNNYEETVLSFLDHLVDAHELEANTEDKNKNFYQRAIYVQRNFHRYSNDTMANLMFQTQLRKTEYDRLNSIISTSNNFYYGATTATHFAILAYATWFFRYRNLSKAQTLFVGTAYYLAFGNINNILYKLMVDKKVIAEARRLGYDHLVQPN